MNIFLPIFLPSVKLACIHYVLKTAKKLQEKQKMKQEKNVACCSFLKENAIASTHGPHKEKSGATLCQRKYIYFNEYIPYIWLCALTSPCVRRGVWTISICLWWRVDFHFSCLFHPQMLLLHFLFPEAVLSLFKTNQFGIYCSQSEI